MRSVCEQSTKNEEAISRYIDGLRSTYTGDSPDKKERAEQLLKKIETSLGNKCQQANELWIEMEKKIDSIIEEHPFATPQNDFTILDDGCGTAIFTYALATNAYRVVGIDPDMNSLSLGMKLSGGNVCIAQGYGEQLPFKNETFDLIISKSVLEHVNDKNLYMAEVYRTLKTPGIFFNIWIPNRWWYLEHHTLLPIYKCFRGREIAIQKHFGLQPYGRIDPPNYFDLLKIMKSFRWEFDLQKGPFILSTDLLSKVINKIAQYVDASKLICSGWSAVAVKV